MSKKPNKSTCKFHKCPAVLENKPGRGAPLKYCAHHAKVFQEIQIKRGVAMQRAAEEAKATVITSEALISMYFDQEEKCKVTDIPFDLAEPNGRHAGPWSVSVHRIDPSKGYEAGNVRLVV